MERVRGILRRINDLTGLARLLAVTAIVALTVLFHWAIEIYIGNYIYLSFMFGVTIISLLFERRGAFIALVLFCIAISYLFLEPRFSLEMSRSGVFAIIVFVILSTILILIGDAFRKITDSLDKADAEKAVLLRELQHRTRNNLQLINAAVRLAAVRAPNSDARDCLENTAQRIEIIGRIGHILNTAINTPYSNGLVESKEYFENLVGDIGTSLADQNAMIIESRIDTFKLNRGHAELLGIVVNELITNSVKYAHPDGNSGTIVVELTQTSDKGTRLVVSDDGVGYPDHLTKGTGLHMVSTLIGMYDGTVSIENRAPGSKVTVCVT